MNNSNATTIDEKELFEKAIAAKNEDNNSKAMEHLQAILEEIPENAEALNLAGIILYEQDDIEEARDSFATAIKNDPSLIDAQHNYGEALIKMKDYENGVKAFVRILENHPDNVPALLRLAQLYAEAGQLDNAEKFCQRVIELEADNDQAQRLMEILPKLRAQQNPPEVDQADELDLMQKAQQANQDGDIDQAFININEILALNPNNSEAYNLAGQMFFNNGNLENAKKSFAAAINCNNNFKEAKINLGETYIKMEEYQQSKEIFEEILKEGRDDTEVLHKLVELSETLGEEEDIKKYEQALSRHSNLQ